MIKKYVFFFFIVLLSGCGFHLRNTADLSMKYPTIILPPSGSNSLHQGLHRALVASDVFVVEQAPAGLISPLLRVTGQNISALPLVYGPDGELRRERLKMSVAFSFESSKTQQFELYTERDRQLNPNQHLGDNAEKVVIEREMQADIISQLLHFLATRPPMP
ncbi:MAG: hypothetical protein JSS07_04230 [Proteobacteria bacterium]|nr:hypothetical protein [Pseudomonadota bacterium]